MCKARDVSVFKMQRFSNRHHCLAVDGMLWAEFKWTCLSLLSIGKLPSSRDQVVMNQRNGCNGGFKCDTRISDLTTIQNTQSCQRTGFHADSGSAQPRSHDLPPPLHQAASAASQSEPSGHHTCRRNNQRGRRQAVKCQLADGSAQWAALWCGGRGGLDGGKGWQGRLWGGSK